ncbi:MAG: hypothetical protein WBX25_35805 [Rhodomicrobium sp.]
MSSFMDASLETAGPPAFIAADIVRIEDGRLAEHSDVLQDERTAAESKSGLPMFGEEFLGKSDARLWPAAESCFISSYFRT